MTHHLHTLYSDGKNSPRQMLEAAGKLGWTRLGFSDHAPVDGESWTMEAGNLDRYFEELQALKAEWAGRIEVLVGLEHDWREAGGLVPDPRTDFWIGSFHMLDQDGRKFAVDGSPGQVQETVALACGGSGRAFVERYCRGLADLVRTARPPVLGHLDLVKKQNKTLGFFDPEDRWYAEAVEAVLEEVRGGATVIEVNTGGLSRGYTDEPYPSWTILKRIRDRGLPIQLNSDTHEDRTLDFAYAEVRARLRDLGFETQRVLTAGGWTDLPL